MKIEDKIGSSQVIILKIEEDDLNALLLNSDIDDDGKNRYMYEEFVEVIINNVPEYAFAFHEDYSNTSNIVEAVRESAKTLMKIKNVSLLKKYFDEGIDETKWDADLLDDYLKTGVFGELILHFILKEFKQTIPLISKVYFKDSFCHEAHGFDSVHVSGETLWLGEAKFYTDVKGGIRELISDLNRHLRFDYLKDQFLIIKRGLSSSLHPEKERWIKKLSETRRLDDIFKQICVPLFCIYSSSIPSQIDNAQFNTIYLHHIEELKKYFDEKNTFPNKKNVNCVLILLPIECKKTLVKSLLEKIVYMQGI